MIQRIMAETIILILHVIEITFVFLIPRL